MKCKIRPIYFSVLILLFSLLFIHEAFSVRHLSYHFSFVGYGGTFKYHDLKILGVPIYWFMLLSGFAITFVVSWFKKAQYGNSQAQSILLPIIFLVISFSGAKLLYIIENYHLYKSNGLEMSGVSLFGAIYLVLIITPIVALVTRKKILAMYDFFTPFGLILLAATRTGCFFNGCCGATKIWKGTNPIILPVQLFEVVCDLLILEICFYIERKKPQKGYMYPVFMLLYGICRFILEFLRDTPKDIKGFSHGQVFSVIAILAAVVMFAIVQKVDAKESPVNPASHTRQKNRSKKK